MACIVRSRQARFGWDQRLALVATRRRTGVDMQMLQTVLKGLRSLCNVVLSSRLCETLYATRMSNNHTLSKPHAFLLLSLCFCLAI
jgi:hypothetical protein